MQLLAGKSDTTLEEILKVYTSHWQPFICHVPHSDVSNIWQVFAVRLLYNVHPSLHYIANPGYCLENIISWCNSFNVSFPIYYRDVNKPIADFIKRFDCILR